MLQRRFAKQKVVGLLSQHSHSFNFSTYGSILFNMKNDDETLYQVLKVSPKAKQKEVKLAYYKKAKEHHPDF